MRVSFCVEEFIKVESAKIDISNFTVFIGNNNSGKTKLMELIYGVLANVENEWFSYKKTFQNNIMQFTQEDIRKLIAELNIYLEENKKNIVTSIFNKNLPLKKMYFEIEEIDCWYEVCYINDSMDILFENTSLSQEEVQKIIQRTKAYHCILILEKSLDGDHITNMWELSYTQRLPKAVVTDRMARKIFKAIVGLNPMNTNDRLFLPASRMGLMMLYKEFFCSKLEENNESKQNAHITKPVLDFLSFVLKYSYDENNAQKNKKTIDFINDKLLDGKLNERGEITTYTPRNEYLEIPLFLSSSMINELDPIMKMLTDHKTYGFLFYDEIETSLHPLKQLELVKLLNRLNNNGMKIILSTHSETFVTKLNNLLLISYSQNINNRKLALCENKVELTDEDLLLSENINVYQFVNTSEGKSVVTELKFRKTPYIGYTFELFEDSAATLFEESKIALGIE